MITEATVFDDSNEWNFNLIWPTTDSMKRSMRVALVGSFNKESVNGVAFAGHALATALADHNSEVVLITLGDRSEQRLLRPNVYLWQFKAMPVPFLLPIPLVRLLLFNTLVIDVYHFHSVFIPAHAAMARLITFSGKPYVLTPHGGYLASSFRNTFRNHRFWKSLYMKLVESYFLRKARSLVALTEREKAEFIHLGFEGRIEVIPNTFHIEPLPPHNEAKLDLDFHIVFMGRFNVRSKGLLFLFAIVEAMQKTHPDVKLTLYGEGPDKDLIEQRINNSRLENVAIKKPVYGMEKKLALRSCTLYCQPSQYEAFGMSMLEAMLEGIPVAYSRGCLLSDALVKNDVGIRLNEVPEMAARQLCDLYGNEAQLALYGQKGKDFAIRNFHPSRVSEQMTRLYQSVIVSHGDPVLSI